MEEGLRQRLLGPGHLPRDVRQLRGRAADGSDALVDAEPKLAGARARSELAGAGSRANA